MEIVEVWINCPTAAVADRIADALIEARLVACANRYPPIESRYRWQGRVETEAEVPLLLKTRATLGDAVEAAARALHPYETPSILRRRIDGANADYARWIHAETTAPPAPRGA